MARKIKLLSIDLDNPYLGGTGNDTIVGDDGDNIINGWSGQDVMTGGRGADTFEFWKYYHSTLSAPDTITDFQSGIDKIFINRSGVYGVADTDGDGIANFIHGSVDFLSLTPRDEGGTLAVLDMPGLPEPFAIVILGNTPTLADFIFG